jgi:4-amino-4-deoxy-L-arabinose transferase-like glycosyltransferase
MPSAIVQGLSKRVRPEALPGWMQLALGALVAYRLIYHSVYVQDVPFALATFSDGRTYELAALDILAAPPLGTKPFYLQGMYAYFMALPMAIKPWVSLALLLQLIVSGLAAWAFFRAVSHWFSRREAGWATMALLAYPGLAFYENKVLTAAIAVATMVALLLALARAQARPQLSRMTMVGCALGLCVLARPNAAIAIPFVLWAVVIIARRASVSRTKTLAAAVLGIALTLVPMAVRNGIVTGTPSVFPVHGGGTTFYIGNNRHARGVWNDAGGLLSGDVAHERSELVARLGIEASSEAREAAAIGRVLYRRAFDEIAQDPGRWAWLVMRKLWLALGNDELTQDYDWLGEQEMLPWAHRIPLPFGALVALACVGALELRRRIDGATTQSAAGHRSEPRPDLRPLAWTLAGLSLAVLGANLVYFTSSQHRLPLVVPLALLAGLGAPALMHASGSIVRWQGTRRAGGLVVLAVVLVAAAAVPRLKEREVSVVHDYNLAVAWLRLGQPQRAMEALDRGVDRRPDHVLVRLERATLRREWNDFEGARADLEAMEALRDLQEQPAWVRNRLRIERRAVGLPNDSASSSDGVSRDEAASPSRAPPTLAPK